MKIALIGLPNCGKSTLFNQVAGYRAETGNFSGTTIKYTESQVRVRGEVISLVDLPGTYTLAGGSPAEREAIQYLHSQHVDLIINVADATQLASALSLTLELIQLQKPLILALNMMDEAAHMGLQINGEGLANELNIPILPLVASKGHGVKNLFIMALETNKVSVLCDLSAEERHEMARGLENRFVGRGRRKVTFRDSLDNVLLHPLLGYAVLLFVLFIFFQVVYGMGALIEPPLIFWLDILTKGMVAHLATGPLFAALIIGVMQGITAGIAIVFPYLLPFLFGLGLLEDVGYLPRIAFLMDALMHRIGLHGKAIVPFILGYGCNVPAIMSTRTLEEPRDRYLASALATLVPCAARLAVVFGLVAFYMGPTAAYLLFLYNLLIIAATGKILSKMLREDSPGMILEMPPYRVPTLKNVISKAWFRVREFIVEAWPVLIMGSAVLALLNYFDLAGIFNYLVRPITWSMNLPFEVGVPLIFGILRKELSLVMLGQALGTMDFAAVMSESQMFVYATFVMFYLPCLATLSVLKRELGMRAMLSISALTVIVALLAAWVAMVFIAPVL